MAQSAPIQPPLSNSNASQQGDVILFQSENDGEINVVNGLVDMGGGLNTMAYLCLFGGNEDDNGSDNTNLQWWGNFRETVKERSETQHLLRSIPVTSFNLKRLEDAAKRDLQIFLDEGVASNLEVFVSLSSLNRIKYIININQETLEFSANWGIE